MNKRINISIRTKIFLSFFLLAFLFVINGIISINIINNNRKFGKHILTVINPSLRAIEDFTDAVVNSKIYTINWVFLKSNVEDKDALRKLHNSDYPKLKLRLNLLAPKWDDKSIIDSLNKTYTEFEQLISIEKKIMASLENFDDYNDAVAKLESERMLEDEVLPCIAALTNSLHNINLYEEGIRNKKINELEHSSRVLRMMTSVLVGTIICLGIFLSFYFTKVIISPINKLRHIINDLGKGIIGKVDYEATRNEIGEMVQSVNNLSEKLRATATFATEVGNRNFHTDFEPLGEEDTLGKALIAMRDNIKLSYQKLNEAQQIAKLGSWERDIKNDHVSLSDELFRIFEIEPVSFDSRFQSILELIHKEDIEIFKDIGRKYMLDHQPAAYEIRIFTAKGNTKNVSIQSKVVLDVNGEVIKTIGIVQDITERIKADTVLKRSEGQLSIATQIAKLGYWEFDVKTGLFTFNDQFYSIFKTTAEKVGGYTMSGERFIELFVYPDDRTAVYTEGTNAITSKSPHFSHQFEYRCLYANGEMGHMVNCYFIVKDDQGRTIKTFGANQDITERKKGEETLLRSEATMELKNKELEQKNKELEQFAYVASHDLQEPLRTTSSFAELLQRQYSEKLDEKANKYLSYITNSSDRMKVLIKDLLDYSRIGKQKELEKVDCNIMLRQVLEDLNKLITDEYAIIQSEKLPIVSGYAIEIQQLFQNLVMNAIKFRKKDTTPQIKISAKKTGDNWQFAFTDNGIGIAAEHNERIFIIFQRLHTRGEYSGSGIGLSHCKKIVELHGGKIWVNSIPGQGSTFSFTLPIKTPGFPNGQANVPGVYLGIYETKMN